MSKRHQASRRRTYGRRQHELHERGDRGPDALSWLDEPELETSLHWGAGRTEALEGWLPLRPLLPGRAD